MRRVRKGEKSWKIDLRFVTSVNSLARPKFRSLYKTITNCAHCDKLHALNIWRSNHVMGSLGVLILELILRHFDLSWCFHYYISGFLLWSSTILHNENCDPPMLIVSHLLLNLLTTVYPRVIDLSIFNNNIRFRSYLKRAGQWFVMILLSYLKLLKNNQKKKIN